MTNLHELEEAFGSDRAIGLYYEVEGRRMTYDAFQAWAAGQEDVRFMDNWQSYMPDGSSSVVCTNYALLVAERFPGRTKVVGFYNDDNPTSRVAIEGIHSEGHDFAIVDDRYLVDPWLKLVVAETERVAFDLQDADDVVLVRSLYGPSSCWSPLQ